MKKPSRTIRIPAGESRGLPPGRWRLAKGEAQLRWISSSGTPLARTKLLPGEILEGQPPHVVAESGENDIVLVRARGSATASERNAWRLGVQAGISPDPLLPGEGPPEPTGLDQALATQARATRAWRTRTQATLQDLRETIQATITDKPRLRWIESRIGAQVGHMSMGTGTGERIPGDFALAETDALGRLWLVFGDSAGHGPGPAHFALFASTLILHHIDAVTCQAKSPQRSQPPPWRHGAEAMRRAGAALSGDPTGQYATAAIAMLMPRRDGKLEVTWTLAGHPHPLVCDPEGKPARVKAMQKKSKAPNGTALGLASPGRGHYPVFRSQLAPKAMMAFVSDGISERMERKKILSIMERSRRHRSNVVCGEIIEAARRDTRRGEKDDRTVLVVRNIRKDTSGAS